MELIDEIFEYYKMGFFKISNFTEPCNRKELNCFILVYLIFALCFYVIISVVGVILSLIFKEQNSIIALCSNIVFIIFNAIHILPLFTLIKRRLNDINPKKSAILFSTLVLMYIIYVPTPLLANTKNDVAYALIKMFTVMPYIILSTICGGGVLVSLIYLMSKQGTLESGPVDSDIQE